MLFGVSPVSSSKSQAKHIFYQKKFDRHNENASTNPSPKVWLFCRTIQMRKLYLSKRSIRSFPDVLYKFSTIERRFDSDRISRSESFDRANRWWIRVHRRLKITKFDQRKFDERITEPEWIKAKHRTGPLWPGRLVMCSPWLFHKWTLLSYEATRIVSPRARHAETQSSCIRASSGSGDWNFSMYSISRVDSNNDSSFSRTCSSNGKRINSFRQRKSNETRDRSFAETKISPIESVSFVCSFSIFHEPVGSKSPLTIFSNCSPVDELGITKVLSGTEYLKRERKHFVFHVNLVS